MHGTFNFHTWNDNLHHSKVQIGWDNLRFPSTTKYVYEVENVHNMATNLKRGCGQKFPNKVLVEISILGGWKQWIEIRYGALGIAHTCSRLTNIDNCPISYCNRPYKSTPFLESRCKLKVIGGPSEDSLSLKVIT